MNATNTTTGYLLTIALPLVAAICVLVWLATRAAEPPAIAQAAEHVESLYVPGDLVVLFPQDRFPDLEFFDERIAAVAASQLPEELERFQRVILVRGRGVDAPVIRRMISARAQRLYTTDVASFSIDLYQLDDPETVLFDLSDQIETAEVHIEPRGEDPVDCPWMGTRFDCPDADWTWVGDSTEVFAGEPFRCVWAHPVDDAELVIRFPEVTGTHVTGWYGLTDYAVSIPDGGPVRMTLEAGDESDRFRAHRQTGRRSLRFALPEDYTGPLEMRISASRPGVRHFCWDLQVVDSRGR